MDRKKFMKDYFKKNTKGAESFDEYQQQDHERAILRAKNIFGLEMNDANELNPLVIAYPEAFFEGGTVKFKYGKAADKVRYNNARVNVLLFGKTHLFFYSALLDYEAAQIANDYGLEVAYKNIVTVETLNETIIEENSVHQRVSLDVSFVDGGQITVRLKDVVSKDTVDNDHVAIDDDTLVLINDVRKLIRRKQA